MGPVQYWILLTLTLASYALQLYAFVDALRRPAHAFRSERKLSKPIWLAILLAAAGVGIVGFPGFLSLIVAVAAIVYLADVRPRLEPYSARRGGRGGGQGGGPGRRPSSGGW
ncbi:DUF2516 family protein [Luteimicrobium subarcticum]|uniref:Uncharacterized protein DUF2516 n=1 Tax=Luteimicrobium subarcticum TaxID=620910 RepID=A0A2M8WVZ3_9MICO|nr:DUF2516 family protein [Luteimicrobium subarcticum]PJI95086.1 uncharacterized protein DUF2516 [Luteimicrobium subarcticum]